MGNAKNDELRPTTSAKDGERSVGKEDPAEQIREFAESAPPKDPGTTKAVSDALEAKKGAGEKESSDPKDDKA